MTTLIGITSWYWVVSSSVRVTSAQFQQGVGRTSTGTNRPYISVICFYSYSRKFLFLLSKNMKNLFLFPLSKLETGISNFSFYSRNSRSEFHISLSTLEIRDHQNLKFLFLLSNLLFWLSSMPGGGVIFNPKIYIAKFGPLKGGYRKIFLFFHKSRWA